MCLELAPLEGLIAVAACDQDRRTQISQMILKVDRRVELPIAVVAAPVLLALAEMLTQVVRVHLDVATRDVVREALVEEALEQVCVSGVSRPLRLSIAHIIILLRKRELWSFITATVNFI